VNCPEVPGESDKPMKSSSSKQNSIAGERHRRKDPTSTIKYLTPEELSRLLGVISDLRDKTIFTVAFHHGLRASEIGQLKVEDYRKREGRLFVKRLKGSRAGEHKLTPKVVRLLNQYLKTSGIEQDSTSPLFPSNRGKGISRKTLDYLMKYYGELAKLPVGKRHFHVLKHSIATRMLNEGVDIKTIQDALGHRNINSTLVYAQLLGNVRDARLEEFYKKLENRTDG
jgi:integrase